MMTQRWDRRFRPSLFNRLNLCMLGAALVLSAADTATKPGPDQPKPGPDQPMTLSISPAVIVLKGRPGQTTTQPVLISNMTSSDFLFEVEMQDVVVEDGKRVVRPVGAGPAGPASTASLSQTEFAVPSGASATVKVTFLMPTGAQNRAAVVLFKGRQRSVAGSAADSGARANLGALVTFSVSNEFQVTGSPIVVSAQTETANATISEFLKNTGPEPVIPRGVAVVLNQAGKVVGKAVFPEKRLLPGERLEFKSDYPSQLAKGTYRVLCSFEYEGETLTTMGGFSAE